MPRTLCRIAISPIGTQGRLADSRKFMAPPVASELRCEDAAGNDTVAETEGA